MNIIDHIILSTRKLILFCDSRVCMCDFFSNLDHEHAYTYFFHSNIACSSLKRWDFFLGENLLELHVKKYILFVLPVFQAIFFSFE